MCNNILYIYNLHIYIYIYIHTYIYIYIYIHTIYIYTYIHIYIYINLYQYYLDIVYIGTSKIFWNMRINWEDEAWWSSFHIFQDLHCIGTVMVPGENLRPGTQAIPRSAAGVQGFDLKCPQRPEPRSRLGFNRADLPRWSYPEMSQIPNGWWK